MTRIEPPLRVVSSEKGIFMRKDNITETTVKESQFISGSLSQYLNSKEALTNNTLKGYCPEGMCRKFVGIQEVPFHNVDCCILFFS